MAAVTDSSLTPEAPRTPRTGLGGGSRLAWLRAWFYVGVPVVLGFLLGWWRVGRSAEWPLAVSIAYWVGVALISTALQAAATQLLSPVLRRLRSPLWLTLLLGQVIGGALLVMPALNAWRVLLRTVMYPDLPVAAQWIGFDNTLQRMPTNSLLWVGLNLLFYYGLRMPRFGYEPAAVAPAQTADPPHAAGPPRDGATAMPPFMTRVRPDRRGELLALEADGHYLHVHTTAGKDLILYRLGDALAELGAEAGARVHRSWWVAQGALSSERHRETLRLVNGLDVPVSRSYRLAARERGWLA